MAEPRRFVDPKVATALIARWRRWHGQAILIVEHFEELFTQNPPAVQESFAELIAALPLAADVHVLISLRDDLRYTAWRWQERGRPDYLLWSGGSRREFEPWRERSPGGLSRSEQAFVDAVARRARQRRNRRRLAVGTALVVLAVLAAIAILWR